MSPFSLRHVQKDREHMLDALWYVGTEHAHNQVTTCVLLGDAPEPVFVERLLYQIGGGDKLPSEVSEFVSFALLLLLLLLLFSSLGTATLA